MVRKRPHQKKVSYSLKNFWAARETTLGRMFYPLFAQGKCFNLAIARIKHPFPFPTIGKNKFLPLVFLWLPKIFQDIGTVIIVLETCLVLSVVRPLTPEAGVFPCYIPLIGISESYLRNPSLGVMQN